MDNLNQIWSLILLEESRRLREEIPAVAKLPLANIQIDAALGEWDEHRRLIRISEALIQRGQFSEITFVLKHETAHQIVSELYGIKSATAHGEAFRRACRLLKISPDAQLCLDAIRDECKVTDRVRKLMALGSSSNQHEAERALTKAHELMLKHNIGMEWIMVN